VVFTSPGDQGLDAASPELAAVLVEVIAPVGEQSIGAMSGPADPAGDRGHTVDQGKELGDVVAIVAGEGDRQRQSAGVCQQVVL
jgi:hypothetical protein